jgi:nucleotide-binding universal stress UspA family protein
VKEGEMSIFPTKILLATDGSEEAALAARTATDVANNTASELHVALDGLSAAYVGIGPPEIADITLGTRVPVATSGWGTLIC